MSCASGTRDERSPVFAGDRYERLLQAADVLAQDPALAEAPFPFNGDGIGAFVAAITEQRIFDRLGERDADVVTMLLLHDYHRGPSEVAERIYDLLSPGAVVMPNGCDQTAVVSGLAAALALMTDPSTWLPPPSRGGLTTGFLSSQIEPETPS